MHTTQQILLLQAFQVTTYSRSIDLKLLAQLFRIDPTMK
jgi:hypothetical protein